MKRVFTLWKKMTKLIEMLERAYKVDGFLELASGFQLLRNFAILFKDLGTKMKMARS